MRSNTSCTAFGFAQRSAVRLQMRVEHVHVEGVFDPGSSACCGADDEPHALSTPASAASKTLVPYFLRIMGPFEGVAAPIRNLRGPGRPWEHCCFPSKVIHITI